MDQKVAERARQTFVTEDRQNLGLEGHQPSEGNIDGIPFSRIQKAWNGEKSLTSAQLEAFKRDHMDGVETLHEGTIEHKIWKTVCRLGD